MNWVAKATIFLLVLGITGCQREEARLPTFKLSGQLVQNNKPVANASIVLHPVNASQTVKPRGRTDANGNFSLTTYDHEDGAPAGDYQVTVEQWLTSNPEEGPRNRLPTKWSQPGNGLSAKVKPGLNDPLKLELTK